MAWQAVYAFEKAAQPIRTVKGVAFVIVFLVDSAWPALCRLVQ